MSSQNPTASPGEIVIDPNELPSHGSRVVGTSKPNLLIDLPRQRRTEDDADGTKTCAFDKRATGSVFNRSEAGSCSIATAGLSDFEAWRDAFASALTAHAWGVRSQTSSPVRETRPAGASRG